MGENCHWKPEPALFFRKATVFGEDGNHTDSKDKGEGPVSTTSVDNSFNKGCKTICFSSKDLLEGVDAIFNNLKTQTNNQTTDQGILQIELFEQEEYQKNNQTLSNFFMDGAVTAAPQASMKDWGGLTTNNQKAPKSVCPIPEK